METSLLFTHNLWWHRRPLTPFILSHQNWELKFKMRKKLTHEVFDLFVSLPWTWVTQQISLLFSISPSGFLHPIQNSKTTQIIWFEKYCAWSILLLKSKPFWKIRFSSELQHLFKTPYVNNVQRQCALIDFSVNDIDLTICNPWINLVIWGWPQRLLIFNG